MKAFAAALLAASLLCAPVIAQTAPAPTAPAPAAAPAGKPTLIVAISVDQFSADLFAEYRNRFTGGFARLLDGAVFPSGYQSHAATETCPGHSTLMTGMRPAHTGIVLNTWRDERSPLADKVIYCVEDEHNAANRHDHYTVANDHLLARTLGERLRAANPASRNVAVSGKDRAAVTMAGRTADETWWWDADARAFATYPGRPAPAIVDRANAAIAARIGAAQPALDLPAWCAGRARSVPTTGPTVGDGRFAREPGNAAAFRASPELDGATLALAAGFVQTMRLGRGSAPDVLSVSLSATDYVGHAYGTQGAEMCLQLASIDRDLGDFFAVLDRAGIDYLVVLAADHGGVDLPERALAQGAAGVSRSHFDPDAAIRAATAAVGLPATALHFQESNLYADATLPPAVRTRLIAAARTAIRAQPDVAAVFTADEIAASPEPGGPPETWPLIMRAKASFYRPRSGDLIVALAPRVSGASEPRPGYVATHGSFWDYDRRVPILFWRRGMPSFEQPLSVETVDIMPTLAAVLGLPVSGVDGRCLDLDPGPASTCP
ncbi:alkaline phosphatase family protein [Sphingomonas sp.]|uniref:alkaline phosphatase family protein n=1 Tax=Sphingomonas sp. TaxID=28214 RepID=UPI003CC6D8D0